MSTPVLSHLESTINDVRDHLVERPRLLQIHGPEASGKSTLLQRLEQELRGEWVPVRISAPVRAPDSGPTAIAQIVDGLSRASATNGALATAIEEQRNWVAQLDLVRQSLDQVGERLMLLLDEPLLWPVQAGSDPYFGDCTRDVLRVVEGAPGTKILAGDAPSGASPTGEITLEFGSEPTDWLEDPEVWGTLAAAAHELAKAGDRLQSYSPLEIRLLVAHLRLNEILDDSWRLPSAESTRRSLSLELVRRLRPMHPTCALIRRAWSFLARVRRPFAERLVDLALVEPDTPNSPENLLAEAADVVRYGLLHEEGGQWVLHERLREDALSQQSWLTEDRRRQIHQVLGQHYADTTGDLLERTVEAFHHASEAANPELVANCRPYFVPQLNAAGRALSLGAQYTAAAALFQRALEWEPSNDYAHHYLAFNLDCAARSPDRVARHYCKAIELRPTHPWWHSRWISFLIARGKTLEARQAWDEAIDHLSLGMASFGDSTGVYQELHRWVAALLLHRGELDFASEVLEGFPDRLLATEPTLKSLKRYLLALVEVAERGGAFVPADRLLQDEPWWEVGPFLLPESLKDGYRLTHWMPGRVEVAGKDQIEFRVAKVAAGVVEDIRRLTVDNDLLVAWNWEAEGKLQSGTFVEIGTYRDDRGNVQNRLFVHRQVPWQDLNLPQLHPDPERYLRAASDA